jgi:hypothetical protein
VSPGGSDILLWGTLAQGTIPVYHTPFEYDCVVPVSSPTSVRVGFAGAVSARGTTAYVEPGGFMAYSDRALSPTRIRSFHPDGWGSAASGSLAGYPSNGGSNDTLYPSSACAPTDPVERFVLRERTGEYLYACGTAADGAWYDADGVATVPGTEIRAWNSAGAILGVAGGSVVVWGADGVKRTVSGLAPSVVIDARANGTGFWAAVQGAGAELWRIDGLGVKTFVATYAAKQAGLSYGIAGVGGILDVDGSLFNVDEEVVDTGTIIVYVQKVVRYPASGSASSIAYDEGDAQQNSRNGPPFINPADSMSLPGPEGFSPLIRGP